MTRKTFTYEYDEYNGNLFDNEMDTFYSIEDSEENIEIFCNRLNKLIEENDKLGQIITEQRETIKDYIKENEQLKEQIRELNRINSICEEQIKELRRLVNIATHNDFIKDSKKEEWKKELMRE